MLLRRYHDEPPMQEDERLTDTVEEGLEPDNVTEAKMEAGGEKPSSWWKE